MADPTFFTPSDLTSINQIAGYLQEVFKDFKRVVLIDVGCAVGDFKALLKLENLYSIGIDPLIEEYQKRTYHHLSTYDVLLPIAIDISEAETDYYVTESLDTSSLKLFNMSALSTRHNWFGREIRNVFYIPRKVKKRITSVVEKRKTMTMRLDTILTKHQLQHETIHILKIDAQGNDLNVLKSCGDLIRRVQYIVFESTYDEAATLYLDSSKFREDNDFLESQGFVMLAKAKLLEHDCDCLYVNRAKAKNASD